MNQRTVLHDSHLALKARIVEFAGWDMPIQYESVVAEHLAVREKVGVFDTSHMDSIWIDGPGSLDALSKVLSQNLRTLQVGACRYGFMLDDTAGILEDLIVYRMDDDAWMGVVNAGTAQRDLEWLQKHCQSDTCDVRSLRPTQSKIDIQGPRSRELFRQFTGIDTSDLKRFRWTTPDTHPGWIVSRTGYTGEDGLELYAPHADIAATWQALIAAGATPCGLGARDTLRLEAGMPLYGHELDTTVSPAEADMMRFASKEEPFIGREALLRRSAAPEKLLTRFLLEGRQTARHGQAVVDADGQPIGRVTSGSFSPSRGQAIGFAYVKPDHSSAGTPIFIDTGRKQLPATITDQPFLTKE